jgi:small subunit ribosomal protein S8
VDTIGDFLTVIRNGTTAGHDKVDVPSSTLKVAIAEILQKSSYISSYKVVKDGKQGVMRIYFNYDDKGQPKINGIRRMSRPGRRYYVGSEEIPNVKSGYGMAVVSTSKGVMSGGEARTQSLGGELLCLVW